MNIISKGIDFKGKYNLGVTGLLNFLDLSTSWVYLVITAWIETQSYNVLLFVRLPAPFWFPISQFYIFFLCFLFECHFANAFGYYFYSNSSIHYKQIGLNLFEW